MKSRAAYKLHNCFSQFYFEILFSFQENFVKMSQSAIQSAKEILQSGPQRVTR